MTTEYAVYEWTSTGVAERIRAGLTRDEAVRARDEAARAGRADGTLFVQEDAGAVVFEPPHDWVLDEEGVPYAYADGQVNDPVMCARCGARGDRISRRGGVHVQVYDRRPCR